MLRSFEAFLEGAHPSQTCDSEAAFYALWSARGLNALAPTEIAIVGGLIADRLPWVFTAGYQATLRNAFVLPDEGWAAFAATEDVNDPTAHPATSLTHGDKGFTLNGCKSWLAHSQVVDQLIITVNDPGGNKRAARGLIIPRHAEGVRITHREKPGFLAAMSQGFLACENTPVASSSVFDFEAIRQFGRTEAKFVMLASCAFLLAHSRDDSQIDRLLNLGSAIIALIDERETSRQVYGAIDREFQRCVDEFETLPNDIPHYAADKRLFRMYSDRVQRRVGYAKADAVARS